MTITISKSRVRQTQVVVEGEGVKCAIVTVTDWENGDGVDVCVHEGTVAQMMSLSSDQLRPLQAAISAHDTFDGVDK